MIEEIEELLKSAVTEVIRTMLSIDSHIIPLTPDAMGEPPHVAGSVGFIGDITGVVYIYSTAAFARQITSAMVQLPVEEIDGDELVNDSMGELANMVVGSLKKRLVEQGHTCILTIPSIVRGNNFSIEATRTTGRRVVCFRCQDSVNLVVEILIKLSEETD